MKTAKERWAEFFAHVPIDMAPNQQMVNAWRDEFFRHLAEVASTSVDVETDRSYTVRGGHRFCIQIALTEQQMRMAGWDNVRETILEDIGMKIDAGAKRYIDGTL